MIQPRDEKEERRVDAHWMFHTLLGMAVVSKNLMLSRQSWMIFVSSAANLMA